MPSPSVATTAEIGELKRLVTVLIQEIDDWPSSSLLVSATNHPDLLDPAIWRRFEPSRWSFHFRTAKRIHVYLTSALAPLSAQAKSWARVLTIALEGQSFSDIDRELKSVRRKAALLGAPLDDHLIGLVNGMSGTKNDRIALATELVSAGVLSQRAPMKLQASRGNHSSPDCQKPSGTMNGRGRDG